MIHLPINHREYWTLFIILFLFTLELKTRLLASKIRLSKRPPELLPKRKISEISLRPAPLSVSTIPDNPTTPAFWIAEGRYRRHLFEERESERRALLEESSVGLGQKREQRHASKLCFIDPRQVFSTARQPPVVVPHDDAPQVEEKSIEQMEEQPPDIGQSSDNMKYYLPPMREPVAPHECRKIRRFHHI